MSQEPTVDIELATELALTVQMLQYFPRRNAQALAAVADVIRQLCHSAEEAHTLMDAIRESADKWESIAAFRRLATGILANMRGQLTVTPAESSRPHCQRCRLAEKYDEAQRPKLIDWTERHCPDCPMLGTARLLQADAEKDNAARLKLAELPERDRQEMYHRIEQMLKRHGARQNASMAHTEPFLTANVNRLMIAEMRARTEGRSLQWIER